MIKRVLFVLLLFISVFSADAAHIVGGDMTYRHVGEDIYEVTISLYRDCASAGADFDSAPGSRTPMNVTLFRNSTFDRIIQLPRPDITRVNLGEQNPCVSIPPNLCVEIGTYIFSVRIPLNDDTYTVSYQRCCRNATIVNVWNPGTIGTTMTIDITPEARRDEIDSPTFNNLIPNVICLGTGVEIDFSVEDGEDGTRFEYEMCTPYAGGSRVFTAPNPEPAPPYDVIAWRPPYSETVPMNSSPRFVLDPVTGMFIGTPTAQGQFIVGVCVYQYKGNELITTIRRDVQFNVTECNKVVNMEIPNIEPIDNKVLECADLSSSITPVIQDPRNVIESIEWEFLDNDDELVNLQGLDFNYTFSDTGVYDITLYVNRNIFGCDDSLEFKLEKRYDILSEFTLETDSCYENQIVIANNSASENTPTITYEWTHSDVTGVASTEEVPELSFLDSGDKTVRLLVRDRYGCEDESAFTFPFNDFQREFNLQISDDTICDNEEVELIALYLPNTLNYDIEWDIDGDTLTGQRIEYTFDSIKTYPISITYTRDDNDCVYTLDFPDTIDVGKSPTAAFEYSPTELNYFNRVFSTENFSTDADSYEWLINGNIVGNNEIIVFELPDTSLYQVLLIAEEVNGCFDIAIQYVDVPPFSEFHMPNAFTPNNDGKNDLFLGKGVPEHLQNFDLSVFSREGREVFQSSDPNEGWNGKMDNLGKIMAPGTYVWRLTYQDTRNNNFEKNGTVTLLR